MADTDRLRDLLHEMERARSPLQRLRLVALAWRTLRGLSKKEREALALKVGMAEAGELVERLATRDGGVAPTELLEAIHAAETTDPDKLRQLVGGVRGVMRDPEGRRGLLNRAAEALDAAAAHAVVPTAAAAVVAGPVTLPKGVPRLDSAAAAPVSTPEPESPTRTASTPPPRTTPLPPPTPRAIRPPTRSIPPREATPPPATPSEHHLRPELPPLPSLAPEPPAAATRRLVDRLASLRRRAGLLQGEGLERLRQEMADLPAGWPRRRALDALLEAGLPLGNNAALELARDLERERDRAWCLGTLLRTRRLTDRELQAALELVSSPATRRRLRRLAASNEGDEEGASLP